MTGTDRYAIVGSPIGKLMLTAGPQGITGVALPGSPRSPSAAPGWRHDPAGLADATEELAAYLAGETRSVQVQVAVKGTEFEERVWGALGSVGYGETVTYGELARRAGAPGAARAVGGALGRNPVPIVVPCHRVVASGGALGGYAGGVAAKAWLLDLESRCPGGR